MRALIVGLLLFGACHSSTLPGEGDGGGVADMARPGDAGRACTIFCTMGFTCCNDSCVNTRNDIHNCGGCGVVCSGPQPFCDGTSCGTAPCTPGCGAGQLCCNVQGPGPSRGPMCIQPTDGGTCPLGCPLCV